MSKTELRLREARESGGIVAEFEALQGVMLAHTARYQWIGEGGISELYRWYVERLILLHAEAQERAKQIPYQMSFDPHSATSILARIRAILDSLPEVQR